MHRIYKVSLLVIFFVTVLAYWLEGGFGAFTIALLVGSIVGFLSVVPELINILRSWIIKGR